ncbi:MAG TPA: glycosyltransferase family 4 protein [Verrucomicrobiae bacterium]|nr:glycosyltransferase family 4 protein [Verrucomicrobiae bacterium]
MKILNVIQCTNLGGMEQASLRLMRGLKERGNQLQLLSLNPIGPLGPLLTHAGIPHEGLPYLGRGGWRSYGLLTSRLKTIDADALVMTGHHLLGSLALGDYCRGRRILSINHHHAGVKPRWEWRLIYRVACRRFDAVTFPCDFIRREAEAIYPPVARIAHTIPYQMEIPLLPSATEKAAARAALGLPLDRTVVGNAGWLIPRKRFDVFLHAAQKILEKKPGALFVVAGDGPEQDKLRQLANRLGIAENVRWLGWQQDMRAFYQSLDVMLFNSDWDAVGLTPLEAMSYGVPAVCSVLNGGLGEILDSDRFGFLLPEHDVTALAKRVLQLLEHPQEAAEIGLAGRKHLQEICDPGPIVDWYARSLAGKIGALPGRRESPAAAGAKKRRIAILFHHVGPYHFARARAAGRLLDATLIEIFKGDNVYGWDPVPGGDGFRRLTLFDHPQTAGELTQGIFRSLDDCRPDAVAIPGWADGVAYTAIRWCVARGVPAIVMSETTEWDEPRRSWKEWAKRRLLKMCAAGLVGGRPHADYLIRLGMAPERVFQGYDAVDNDFFAQKADELRRRNNGDVGKGYFLASARFIPKKNLLRLVEAYGRYRALARDVAGAAKPWDLVLLGDGPLKADLVGLISRLELGAHVSLPGFKQFGELPEYYAGAKVFVHASTTEQWGLVVNEAMASGLPVLVSNRCGCARDLVQDGVNGFTFDPYDTARLAELLLRLWTGEAKPDLDKMGKAGRKTISGWGPDRFAAGLAQAVEAAVAAPKVTLSAADRLFLKLLPRK